MILPLYGFLVAISLVLIIIGLTKPSESAQALVGFFFLFLLATSLIGGNLQYEVGANMTTNISYDVAGNVISTEQTVSYGYQNFNDETSRRIGIYLAIAAAVGFAGVLFALGRTKWGQE